ncbi:MAG TPA: hypothetical protein VFQ45_05785 [Longimicrobium sp.]|nr:hypothetical protein [Longimicrobium sp.]
MRKATGSIPAPASDLRLPRAMSAPRVFLLSPAYCGGKRAQLVMRDAASFPLARQLRAPEGAPLGDVFSFLSGLYFRGKMAYVKAFDRPPDGLPGALVITSTRGLVPPESRITLDVLREFAEVGEVAVGNVRYQGPLEEHMRAVDAAATPDTLFVLLGSIASDKYVRVLTDIVGERLVFPPDFVGRGDMSRGGLMLRAAESGKELEYVPVLGAVRHGPRPPRLEPRSWKART